MLTLKRLMNITNFRTAHPIHNITQSLLAVRVVGTNGKPILWENT
jgi:hypothetical protein